VPVEQAVEATNQLNTAIEGTTEKVKDQQEILQNTSTSSTDQIVAGQEEVKEAVIATTEALSEEEQMLKQYKDSAAAIIKSIGDQTAEGRQQYSEAMEQNVLAGRWLSENGYTF